MYHKFSQLLRLKNKNGAVDRGAIRRRKTELFRWEQEGDICPMVQEKDMLCVMSLLPLVGAPG
jgi:hypothetical protein